MGVYRQIETLPCDVRQVQEGLFSVTFTMPENQIKHFVAILNSLTGLFQNMNWKAKTNMDAIHIRNAAAQIEHDKILEQYEKYTLLTYQTFVDAGNSSREALSLTVSKVHERYAFSSYDNIKKCLTKNKLLKNTGFYKTR